MILDRDLGSWDYVGAAILGLSTGVISLFFGVGGGVVLVPCLNIFFGFNMATSTMVSQSTMLFSTTTSAILLMVKKRVDLWTCLWFSLATIPGSIVSGFMATFLQSFPEVQLAFGILMTGLTIWKITLELKKCVKNRKAKKGLEAKAKAEAVEEGGEEEEEEVVVDIPSEKKEQVSSDKEEGDEINEGKALLNNESSITNDGEEEEEQKDEDKDAESSKSKSLSQVQLFSTESEKQNETELESETIPKGRVRLRRNGKVVREKCLCVRNVVEKYQKTAEGNEFNYQIKYFPGLILAFFGRVVGGLFGLGGGVMFIPILTMMMGVPIELATGVSNASIAVANPFTILVRSLEGDSEGLWGIIAVCGVCTVVSVLLGGLIIAKVKQGALIIGFWVLVLASSIKLIYDAAVEMAEMYGPGSGGEEEEEELVLGISCALNAVLASKGERMGKRVP